MVLEFLRGAAGPCSEAVTELFAPAAVALGLRGAEPRLLLVTLEEPEEDLAVERLRPALVFLPRGTPCESTSSSSSFLISEWI